MAKYIATTDGNWSTLGTWSTGTNVPTQHASTTLAITGTHYTAKFTAPNTTNSCIGVIFVVSTMGTSTYDYTVTLQENEIDTACAKTISGSVLDVSGNAFFVKFDTPYVFTSTTADYYRFKIVRSGSGATNMTVLTDSGGTLVAFQAVDNRNPAAAPTSGDDVWVIGANGTGTVTVTLDGTRYVGSAATTTNTSANILQALYIGAGGLLKWDTTASASLTVKYNIAIGGRLTNKGELQIGTASVPYPAAYTAKLIFDNGGTTGNAGWYMYQYGRLQLHGAPKPDTTNWKTTYASGSGTVGSPMVVADAVDWTDGDTVLVASTGTGIHGAAIGTEPQNETFTITKVNATTYSLVSTNKFLNPSFEGAAYNTVGWTGNVGSGAIALETTSVNSGYKALKLTAGATTNTYVYQQFSVQPNVDCTLEFYTRGDGTYAGQYVIVKQNGTPADIVSLKSTGVTGTTYTKVTENFTTPAGCTYVRVYLYCPSTNGGVAYFDDVSVTYKGLQYTHTTDAYVLNVGRNVMIQGFSQCDYWGINNSYPTIYSSVSGDIDYDWAYFDFARMPIVGEYIAYGNYFQADYCVVKNQYYYAPFAWITHASYISYPETYTGNIVYGDFLLGVTPYGFSSTTHNKSLVDCFAIGCSSSSFYYTSGNSFTRCVAISNYSISEANTSFYLNGSGFVLTDCEAHSAGRSFVKIAGSVQATFIRFLAGTKGAADIYYGFISTPTSFQDIDWIDCVFTAAEGATYTTIPNASDNLNYAPPASEWRFQNYGGAGTGVDFAITPAHYRYKVGTGMSDTTVHTAGGYANRFQSVSSTLTGSWEFYCPTGNIQNKTMMVGIWCKINSANYYSATYQLPRLTIDYDNGTTAYCQAATTTDWQLLYVAFTPTTTFGEIKITLSSKTDQTTTSSYVYWDDFSIIYPAGYTLNLGAMDIWSRGNPVTPPIATTLSAADVWTASSTVDWGASTMGKHVAKKLLKQANFIALK